tara:strand:+ start:80 stop:466 length:387 start_codon:yes stop_codon:yes gene_type:complete
MKIQISYKIPFHDTDSLGIIWYGNYYKYFELVRNHFFQKIKFDINEWENNNLILMMTESNCKYLKPLKYNDYIKISASIIESMYRLKLNYNIHKGNLLTASGFTIQVAVKKNNYNVYKKLPKILRDKI